MSGGHWDYEDCRVGQFGERLQEDSDFLLRALGDHLVAIGKVLHDVDWQRSGDTAGWDRSELYALLPPGSAIEAARRSAEDAVRNLNEAIAQSMTSGNPLRRP